MHTIQRSLRNALNMPLTRSGPSTYETKSLFTPAQDEYMLYIESTGTLLYDLKRSDSVLGVVITFSTFFRSITSASATGTLVSLFTKLAEELSDDLPFWQSSNWIDVCDDFHKNIHRVRDCALGKKLIKVINHVVAHTFYFKLGINVDDKIFSQLEKNYIQPTVWNVLTFADAIVSLLLFLAKAGRQALLTGSAEAFFVDSETVSNWLLKGNRLRKDAEFLGNPSAINLDTISFFTDIEDTIADGKRLSKTFSESQRILINNIIVELELVQKRYRSTMAAASFRFCPFGLFLFGDSGVGKSFLIKGMFYHYASVRGLKKEKAILYSRNPDDKYYSGFKSNMLGVLYDDVAKHVASKVMGIDQSLTDIIGVVNNIPLITNQAEAPDKGKIPLLAEWMGVTSNIAQLDVHAYYKNTYAVLRRMPYRIEPKVKEEFRKVGTTQLDSTKIPQGVLYPDCWTFEVCEVQRHDVNSLHGHYAEHGRTFQCYADLLVWLTGVYETHIANQLHLMETVNSVGPELLCKCRLPVSLCSCDGSTVAITDLPIPTDSAVAQLGDVEMMKRMQQAVEIRRTLSQRYGSLEGTSQLYFTSLRTRVLDPWISDYTRIADIDSTPDEMLEEISSEIEAFELLPTREKIFAISRHAGINVDTQEDYLTFQPKIGGQRNFFRSQLKLVYDYILPYAKMADWDAERLAALEIFVYEKVPQYLSSGWDDDSILKAAFDYVDVNAQRLAAADNTARDLLLSDFDTEVSYRDAICRFLGIQYFTRPWVFRSVNYLADTRLGRYVGRTILTPRTQTASLIHSGGAYDKKLLGGHRLVVLLITIGSSVIVISLVKMALRFFSNAGAQLSLDAIGKKPKQRDEEKTNVWRVEERTITSLDFHPRRPNTLSQMLPGIRNNSLLAEIHAVGIARATTRVLIINNTTLVMNNHSCFESFKLTVYLGKKPENGVVAKFVVDVEPSMIRRIPQRDLAIITTLAMPCLFKDISTYLPRKTFSSVGSSFYYVPEETGVAREIQVYGVSRMHLGDFTGSKSGVSMLSLAGTPDSPTRSGDCGSPLVIQTGHGPVIAGIHCAFNATTFVTHAAPLFYDDFDIVPMVQVGTVTPCGIVAQSTLESKDKLYTDFHKEGQLMVFGALRGFRPRPKANGRHTSMAPFLLHNGPAVGLAFEDRLTNPDMGSWEPQQNILKEYLCPTHSMKESLFRLCCDSFSSHITYGLTEHDIEDIHVVPLSVAVNGFPQVPNVDAQKFSTSAGHGFPGPKQKHVTVEEDFEDWALYRKYDDEVVAEIIKIYELTTQGIRSHPIFTAQMKDEMVSLAKRAAKKTRGFYMCPVAFLTVMRMFTTGLTRVMVRRRDLFRHAVGLNTHSEQWDDLFRVSQEIPGDNWMAGDFKGFDKILSILIQNGAKKVFLAVAEYCGFSSEELLALDTLLSDNITAVVDFFGTLIMFLGGEVSGHQITTFFNSICNILLHLYAWTVLSEEQGFDVSVSVHQFWTLVFIRVLGDDIMAKVHPSATWYNHTTVQRVFKSIGIEYTMADKLSESVPYISYKEVGFLKRKFADHELFPGMKVAILDKESIFKMLVYTNPSKTISEEEQMAMSICSAKSEAFFHGQTFYKTLSDLIDRAPKTPELQARMIEFPAPSWNQMYERFLIASPKHRVLLVKPGQIAETTPTPDSSYCQSLEPHAQASWRMDCWGSTTMECSSEESDWTGIRLSPKKHARRRCVEKNHDAELQHLSKSYTHTFKIDAATRQMAPAAIESAIRKATKKNMKKDKKKAWDSRVVAQSESSPDTTGSVTSMQQTYAFKDEPMSRTVDIRASSSQAASSMAMPQGLGDYFKRPVLISSFTWTEAMSTGTQNTTNPWALYLANTSLKEKMGGFGLVRANLHLKFTVNGSPFYYGALSANYTPLSGFRTDTVSATTNLALVQQSQKPHVWLNVQNTSSAEMIVPFLYPYPMMESTLANYTAMGKIDLIVYTGLKSANGVTGSSVDIQTFAWLEDIELAGPTNQPVSQSSIEYEANGQVSGPASAVANVASKLSNVPILGEYARATETVANGIGKVASLFGFTNVPNIRDVEPIRSLPFELASTEISTPLTKLSLDPKQEISVGSSQHGGSVEDELVISRFAGRQSFLVGSNWATSAVPGDILYTSFVTPQLWQTDGSTAIVFPPAGYLSQMFQYWRGSMKFTFKMIRSKYHRGRVQISWDRSANNLNEGATLGNLNTFSTIMDLDETDEVTIVVPYVQNRQFLSTSVVSHSNAVLWSTSSTPPNQGLSNFVNGVINVRVLNRLTAPEASSDVELLVFVSAGDDIEFAAPRNLPGVFSTIQMRTMSNLVAATAQSAVVYEEEENVAAHQNVENPKVYMEVFGEKVTSLRQYLHRSSMAKSYIFGSATDGTLRATIGLKHMPPSPGIWFNGVDAPLIAGVAQSGNICPQHPIPLIANCFIGMKGSVNVTANVKQGGGALLAGYVDVLSIDRVADGESLSAQQRRLNETTTVTTDPRTTSVYFHNTIPSGVTGKALSNTRTNASITANLPYYNNAGFFVSDLYKTYNNTDSFSGANADWYYLTVQVPTDTSAKTNQSTVDVYYGTGPDFDLIFFINTPVIFTRTYSL